MRLFSGCCVLGLSITGCDQILLMIQGQAPEVAATDTAGSAEEVPEVAGVVEVEAPPATAQVNDDKPIRDGDTLEAVTRISHELAEALQRYLGFQDPVDPFADTLSGHETPPFNVDVVDLGDEQHVVARFDLLDDPAVHAGERFVKERRAGRR